MISAENDFRYYMTEHCGVKAGLAGGMGYLLGCVMGLFLYGGQADMNMATGTVGEQPKGLRAEWRMMKGAMNRSGKNFGMIGGMFAGTECLLGKHALKF